MHGLHKQVMKVGRSEKMVFECGTTGIAADAIRRSAVDSVEAVESPSSEAPGLSNPISDFEEKEPNKSPEPTTTAVTPRADEMTIEMKPSNPGASEARVAPAVVVAHL